ncbi:MAG TPA: SDR family oxidoreductase [Micromonosporaceae bacterium]|nr:SDR family oxidoreductase [Micromonosporaceae bacterium]
MTSSAPFDSAPSDGRIVAVTGATGALGSRVARRLAAAGVAQRLVVRDASRAPSLPGAEVTALPGGYRDGDAMVAALSGVHTVFLVSASESPDRRAVHATAVDAAVDAGVAHVVYVSFAGAAPQATFTFARDHYHTEEHIKSHDVAYTMLRNNLYLDLLTHFVGPDGVLRGPAGDGRFAGVTREDIADVAAAVLTASITGETAHHGRTYDVTGPEAITMAEFVAALTAASGRLITYDAETLDQAYASRASYGAPDWEVAGWVTTYAAVAASELASIATTVADITGHEPMSVHAYLAAFPHEIDHLRTA